MILHLSELAKQGTQSCTVTIEERLPAFLHKPCKLDVNYSVDSEMGYYLVHLHVEGILHCNCQRCTQDFDHQYTNSTVIAICSSEEKAEQLQDHYECIVVPHNQIQLAELVTDELHLYAPEFHPNIEDCSGDIMEFLRQG